MKMPLKRSLAYLTARRGRARTFRPCVESLETRNLLSITVHPGELIQHAVDVASAGTVINIEPGTYKQTVTVDKAGIQLVGQTGGHGAKVVIENPGTEANGISVTSNGTGFVLENVVVRGFLQDGISLTGVDGFAISHVAAQDNLAYGIFPVYSAHGRIEFSTASGSNDTGIYVGQSSHVAIRYDVAFDNVNGIEIENCSHVAATGNSIYHNTVGIVETLLPPSLGLTVIASDHNVIADNVVFDNNRPNSADPMDLTGAEPRGIGILLIGGDHAVVKENVVLGNGLVGIVLASGLDVIVLAHLPPGAYGSVNPYPENTRIEHNVVLGNGLLFAPPPGFEHPADLVWTPSAQMGHNNVWANNIFGTSFPEHLPK